MVAAAAAIAEAAVDARRPQSFGSPLIAAVHSVAQTIRGEQVGWVVLYVGSGGAGDRDTGCEASLKANEVRDRVPPLLSPAALFSSPMVQYGSSKGSSHKGRLPRPT